MDWTIAPTAHHLRRFQQANERLSRALSAGKPTTSDTASRCFRQGAEMTCSIGVSTVVFLRGNRWSTYELPRNTDLRIPMEPNIGIPDSRSAYEQVRWRPWPCPQCAAGATPVGFLSASHRTNPQISDCSSALPINERIEHLARFERDQLSSWCAGCEHLGGFRQDNYLRIAEGSEHIVYKETGEDESLTEIVKITHPELYGDYYTVIGGRISQFACTPGQYLKRMELLDMFGLPTTPVGLTESGQIISRQKFIVGELPSQSEVNAFMSEAGMLPVKVECFLWKMPGEDDVEIWVGDARDENFVKTSSGIIPIDIRIWVNSAGGG